LLNLPSHFDTELAREAMQATLTGFRRWTPQAEPA